MDRLRVPSNIAAVTLHREINYFCNANVSDSRSRLLPAQSNPLVKFLTSYSLQTSLIFHLGVSLKTVRSLWVPSHVGKLLGNETADLLATSTERFSFPSASKTPFTDFILHLKLG